MMTKTRHVVVASLSVLAVGIGTGLVAHYVGLPLGAGVQQMVWEGSEELRLVPRDAALVAYVNVQEVMRSEVRQKIHDAIPAGGESQQEFWRLTGIDIEADLDRLVACLVPVPGSGRRGSGMGLVLARGRFDEAKIGGLLQERGARVEDYKGSRLLTIDQISADSPNLARSIGETGLAVSFVEPGLAAVGSPALVRRAIDLKLDGGESISADEEMMALVRPLDLETVWAAGGLDTLREQARLPAEAEQVAQQLSAVTQFSVSGQIGASIRGLVRLVARDEESAADLREVLGGLLALGRLQVDSRPAIDSLVRSLELSGAGTQLNLSFEVPAELFDGLGRGIRPGALPDPR